MFMKKEKVIMKYILLKRMMILTLIVVILCSLCPNLNVSFSSNSQEVKYEFENGIIKGTGSVKTDSTASKGKYMHLESNNDVITINVDAEEEGMYNLKICYKAPYGNKVEYLYINEVYQTNISLIEEDWTEIDCGTFRLNEGENKIEIKAYWGWADFDYLSISPFEESMPISATQTNLCDKDATKEAKSLMRYLSSVYGKHIISGQQEIYPNGHDGNYEYEFEYIENLTGKLPAIRGFDYLACNPINGYPEHKETDGTTERIIDWVKNKNGIATVAWHLVVPKDFNNYKIGDYVSSENATYAVKENGKDATTFDASKVIVDGTKENEYYQMCLKNLGLELEILQDNNIPVIFRPLHEAEGSGGENGAWFWWGQDGSEIYKKIWIYTYETLVEKYNLHNLIWEWNSYNYETSANWYPGDEYVDIIGYDKYSCKEVIGGKTNYIHNDSPMSSTFYGIMKKYNSKKMIAMSENDSFSTVQNLITEKAGWLYFCTWYDGYTEKDGGKNPNYVSDQTFNTTEDTIEMYNSDYCITLDELPLQLYSSEDQDSFSNNVENQSTFIFLILVIAICIIVVILLSRSRSK